jgi:regulatory protein
VNPPPKSPAELVAQDAGRRSGPSLKNRALRLLTSREHSRPELERKLAGHAATPEELTEVLDLLTAKGFISHDRVAASVVYRRAPKLGLQRIAQELQQKGLEPDLVRQAMADLKPTELARARAVWSKKFDAPPANPADKAKQCRFLASRGFGAEVIFKVVGGSFDEE